MKQYTTLNIICLFLLSSTIGNIQGQDLLHNADLNSKVNAVYDKFNIQNIMLKSRAKSLSKLEIKGHVKNIVDSSFTLVEKFGKIQQDKMISKNCYTYDEFGNNIQYSEYQYYLDTCLLKDSFIYKYDKINNITELCIYSLDKFTHKVKLEVKYTYKYKYNEITKLKECLEIEFKSNKNDSNKYNYIYNEKGMILEEINYNKSEGINWKGNYKYDINDNIIEYNRYDQNDSLSFKEIYVYDEIGNVIQLEVKILSKKQSRGLMSGRTTFTYDEKKRIIEINGIEENGSLRERIVVLHKPKENSSEYYMYKVDNIVGKIIYQANDVEMIKYSKNGEITGNQKIKFEYDIIGNWTKMIEYNNNVPRSMTLRKIMYY